MKLAALVEAEDHVCCRYRLAAFRALLADAGHSLDLQELPRTWSGRLTIGSGMERFDAVILQRKLLPRFLLSLLRRRVRRLIFDFDDAVWLRDSYSPKGFDDPRRARRFRATLQACDLVIAGNDYLAKEARRWVSADRVAIIPTCVDTGKYPPLAQSTRVLTDLGSPLAQSTRVLTDLGSPRATDPSPLATRHSPLLVWVGSSSTLRGLEQFVPTLSAIGQAIPGIRLKLICDRFIEIPHLPVEPCNWKEATEPSEIAAADIGIGYVPDDPWSRGKCGLKLLQYMAAGLPVVANPVGVQASIVRSGVTGFTATGAEEWVNAIRILAEDESLRRRLGEAGHRQVEQDYSVEAGAAMWIAALAEGSVRAGSVSDGSVRAGSASEGSVRAGSVSDV